MPRDAEPHECAVCGRASRSKCSQCRQVWYCCVDHQREHWMEGGHRAECAAIVHARQGGAAAAASSHMHTQAAFSARGEDNDSDDDDKDDGVVGDSSPTTAGERGGGGGGASSTAATTFLRPGMAPAYYDAAEQAMLRVETFEFVDADVADARHPNVPRAVADFLRVNRDALQRTRAANTALHGDGTLTVGHMLRNGTNAAHSLLAGRARHEAVPRDAAAAPMFDRMEAALPRDVPLSYHCGYADATLAAKMLLCELSAERAHTDAALVGAAATCAAMYVVVQDRIRERLDRYAAGAASQSAVAQQVEQMHAARTDRSTQ